MACGSTSTTPDYSNGFSACCQNFGCGTKAGLPDTLEFHASIAGLCLTGNLTGGGTLTKGPSSTCAELLATNDCPTILSRLCGEVYSWELDPADEPECGVYIKAASFTCLCYPTDDPCSPAYPLKYSCQHLAQHVGSNWIPTCWLAGSVTIFRIGGGPILQPSCHTVIDPDTGTLTQHCPKQNCDTCGFSDEWVGPPGPVPNLCCCTCPPCYQCNPPCPHTVTGDDCPSPPAPYAFCCSTGCTEATALIGNCFAEDGVTRISCGSINLACSPCLTVVGQYQQMIIPMLFAGCRGGPDDLHGCNPYGCQPGVNGNDPKDTGNFFARFQDSPVTSIEGCLTDVTPLCSNTWMEVSCGGMGAVRLAGKAQPPRPLAGTELKSLLTSLGIREIYNCSCASVAAEMDRMGLDWCRANLNVLAGKLRQNAKRYGWVDMARAAALAISHGLLLNPLDPYPGLVTTAIKRAARKPIRSAA